MNQFLLLTLFCLSTARWSLTDALQPKSRQAGISFLEVEQACPAGTVLQSIPQSQASLPSYAQNLVRKASFTCGTGQSNCSFCAPSGVYTSYPGSFIISPRCTSPYKKNAWASWSSNSAPIGVSFGAYPTWDLTATVPSQLTGWVHYEVCDSFNNYGSWVAPINGASPSGCKAGQTTANCSVTCQCVNGQWGCVDTCPAVLAQPPCTLVPPAVRQWPTCCDTISCPGSNCSKNLPQSTALPFPYPAWLQNPFTQPAAVTCGTATSTCVVCAPNAPLAAGSFTITSGCTPDPRAVYLSWAGSGTPSITGSFQGMGYSGTLSKSSGDYGWIKYEFCDQNNAYGSWVVFF